MNMFYFRMPMKSYEHELSNKAIVQPLYDMFQCSFDNLPDELLLNPFFWKSGYFGLQQYLQCAQKQGITDKQINQCFHILLKTCPLNLKAKTHNNIKVHHCYQLLVKSRFRTDTARTANGDLSVSSYTDCVFNLYQRIRPCIIHLKSSCLQSKLVVIKTIRLDMQFVGHLLQRDPDIKIVHLVRDPRGMLLSRSLAPTMIGRSRLKVQKNTAIKTQNAIDNAETLCRNLKRNIDSFRLISDVYPKLLIQIRYEDLAENPRIVSRKIYGHVNLSSNMTGEYFNAWFARINNHTHNSGYYRTYRKNSTAEAYDWLQKLGNNHRHIIESITTCINVIRELNYPGIIN